MYVLFVCVSVLFVCVCLSVLFVCVCVCVCVTGPKQISSAITTCRLRAARVDDFVGTLRELHKEFQWPFPTHTNNNTTTTTSRLQEGVTPVTSPICKPQYLTCLVKNSSPGFCRLQYEIYFLVFHWGKPGNETSNSLLLTTTDVNTMKLTNYQTNC